MGTVSSSKWNRSLRSRGNARSIRTKIVMVRNGAGLVETQPIKVFFCKDVLLGFCLLLIRYAKSSKTGGKIPYSLFHFVILQNVFD